jgi:hypothetical protein
MGDAAAANRIIGFARRRRSGFDLLAPVLAGATARGALAVIGFFDFTTWLGHRTNSKQTV